MNRLPAGYAILLRSLNHTGSGAAGRFDRDVTGGPAFCSTAPQADIRISCHHP
ncbi:MAG: hypothetical protein MI863_04800 [Desulfobacterales bacterium]|nr:hypothetical protein [Desulfobacterales bacterium]